MGDIGSTYISYRAHKSSARFVLNSKSYIDLMCLNWGILC